MDALQEPVLMDEEQIVSSEEISDLLSGEYGMLALLAARELVRMRDVLDRRHQMMREMACAIEASRLECVELREHAERYAATIEELSIKLAG